MPQPQPDASPPTLFALKSLDSKRGPDLRNRRRATSQPRRVTSSTRRESIQHEKQYFRIDAAESSATINDKRRPDRHRVKPRRASANPSTGSRQSSGDFFHDHAGDLIQRLTQWSMQLDQRECRLDHRADELNRQQRILRQCLLQQRHSSG